MIGLHTQSSTLSYRSDSRIKKGLTHKTQAFKTKPNEIMAERTGLEPATPGVTGRYSNQLNYLGFFSDSKVCTS